MRRRAEIRVASRLLAKPELVWERVMSAEGINDELGPLMRMTVPRRLDSLDLDAVEPGQLGRSRVLLCGRACRCRSTAAPVVPGRLSPSPEAAAAPLRSR